MFLAPVTTALIRLGIVNLNIHAHLLIMETQVTPQIVETQSQQVNEEITPIAQSQQVNEQIPAIAQQQARVTKNPLKVAAGRKGALARKAKVHNSNTEHSRPIKTWAPYAVEEPPKNSGR